MPLFAGGAARRQRLVVGTIMTSTLKKVESFGPNLEIDAESVIGPIRNALGAREKASARRRETEKASEAEGTAGLVAG